MDKRILTALVVFALTLTASVACFAQPEADLQQGRDLIAAGKYNEAINVLKGVNTTDPLIAPDVQESLGDSYRLKQFFAEAIPYYEAVLTRYDITPEQTSRVQRWLIKCHIRHQDWSKVQSEIDAVAADNPNEAGWWYFALGKRYLRVRDHARGISTLDKAISLSSDPSRAYVLREARKSLVQCCVGARKWDRAVREIAAIRTGYPKEALFCHEWTGAVYQGQKKYAQAIAELKQAIDPVTAITARKRLAECYQSSLPSAEAAQLIHALDVRFPKDGPYLSTLVGKLYEKTSDYDNAVTAYKSLIARFPEATWQVWDANFYIAGCMFAQGTGADALQFQREFYEPQPLREPEYLMTLGRTYMFAAKDSVRAQAAFEDFLSKYPHHPLARAVKQWYAECQSQTGQTAKAKEILTNLLPGCKTAAEEAEILFDLAYCSYWAHDYATARAAFDTLCAKSRAGKYIPAGKYMAGDCCVHLRDTASARTAFQSLAEDFKGTKWEKLANERLAKL